MSEYLDLIRGVSAVLVMIGHLRALFFVEYAQASNPGIVVSAVYFMTGLGHQAVMVFFVLSGFLIGSSVLNEQLNGRWSWKRYVTRRLTRLYIVLLPGLLLTELLDRVGIHLFGISEVYGGLPASFHTLPDSIADRLGPDVLLGNLAFVQGIATTTLGSASILWSLTNEFWYYALFPLLLLSFVTGKTHSQRAACLAVSGLILILIGASVASYFLVWCFGVGVVLLPRRTLRYPRISLSAATCGFSAALVVTRFSSARPFLSDVVVAATFAILVWILDSSQRSRRDSSNPESVSISAGPVARDMGEDEVSSRFGSVSRSIAGFSYSLYVVHLPLLVFLVAWYRSTGGDRWQPSLTNLLTASALSLLVISYAWGFSRITERNTTRVWKLLFSKPVEFGSRQ
jgi:peptidoglycan/LPS O-acetylase OafA/YrhL